MTTYSRVEPEDLNEQVFQAALRPFPRKGALRAVIGAAAGCGVGMWAHVFVCLFLVSESTLLVGLIPLFGIACTGQLINAALYVLSGMLIGSLTGLIVGAIGWRRVFLVVPIVLAGIGLSVIASRVFSGTVNKDCATQIPYSV